MLHVPVYFTGGGLAIGPGAVGVGGAVPLTADLPSHPLPVKSEVVDNGNWQKAKPEMLL